MLTNSKFEQSIERLLGSEFKSRGFEYSKGVFKRTVSAGIRHIVVFDHRPSRGHFQVNVGLDTDAIGTNPPHGATYATRYLSPGGLGLKPQVLAARDQETAARSIDALRPALVEHAFPWLDAHSDLDAVAEALGDDYDFYKGKLYLLAGKAEKARPWLERNLKRLSALPKSPELDDAIRETQELLAQANAS